MITYDVRSFPPFCVPCCAIRVFCCPPPHIARGFTALFLTRLPRLPFPRAFRNQCCGTCCGMLSAVGILFLFFLGFALEAGSTSIDFKGDRKEAAMNCYIAAVIYIVFFLLSLFCQRKARQLQEEEAASKERQRQIELKEENEDIKAPILDAKAPARS